MAIDPQAPPGPEPAAYVSAIENELPTYRAISSLAVGSLISGLVGGLAFADLRFAVASALAVVLGGLSLWKIRQQPDALTGGAIAQAGIALGLIFGLSSVTLTYTQSFLLARRAEAFIRREIVPILNDRNLDETLWFKAPPDDRRGMTPRQVRDRFADPKNPDPFFFEMAIGSVGVLMKELRARPDAQVVFDRVEQTSYDGITPIVLARLRVEDDDHDHAGHDPSRSYIGLVVKSQGEGKNQSWWVGDYLFPYKPNTYEAPVKSVEAEHGHDH